MILVDTSVWSLALRRRTSGSEAPGEVQLLRELISADEDIALPGIVLQEILSGVREAAQFVWLRERFEGFPVVAATEATHVAAARIANACRRKGIAVSTVDCLIGATATEHNAQLFTTDKDFIRMAEHCPLKLLDRRWK